MKRRKLKQQVLDRRTYSYVWSRKDRKFIRAIQGGNC